MKRITDKEFRTLTGALTPESLSCPTCDRNFMRKSRISRFCSKRCSAAFHRINNMQFRDFKCNTLK